MTTMELLRQARAAKNGAAALDTERKNRALLCMAEALIQHTEAILAANRKDMEAAQRHISEVMLDRLALTPQRIADMVEGVRQAAALPDPVGRVLRRVERPNGLVIERRSAPVGVVAIIYESRPNVTSDAAALTVKAGSVCILRCGKEAHRSAAAIVAALQQGLERCGLNPCLVQLVEETSRQSAQELMTATGYVDLLIPRGGRGLIRSCVENASVPVIETGTGICHVYADESADVEMVLDIVENAKTSRPSVCNAEEVLLVHEKIAEELLPRLYRRLTEERAAAGKPLVELRCCPQALKCIPGIPAEPEDFDTEFLDYILAVKIVGSLEEAIEHIAAHSTGHSDAILTRDEAAAARFTDLVDSAAVYVNASTRFTDGGEFGLGCEMGISTQKLHARGPMGLEELCTYKYVITGQGQLR